MVETITPVVHGNRRRWIVAVAAHTVGAGASAAIFGALLGGLGRMLGAPWGSIGPASVAVVATLYALGELTGRAVPVPQAKRQVPEWWRTFFGPIPAAALYGIGLGVGFLTYLRSGALVAAAAAALASGRPGAAALVLAAFGIARGASVVVVGRARSSRDVALVAERVALLGASRIPRIVGAVGLAMLAAAATRAAVVASDIEIAPAASAAIALTMGWAALAKIARPDRWRATVRAYGLGPVSGPVVFAVPAAEIAVAVLGVARQTRAAGAACLVLLACFSTAAVWARMRSGAAVPCGCFGGVRARPLRSILARNAALGVVAALAFSGADGPVARAPALPPDEILPFALLVLGVAALSALAVQVRALGAPTPTQRRAGRRGGVQGSG